MRPAAALQLDDIVVGGDLTIREVNIHQYFGPERRDPASRNRRAMLEKVWAIWIAGVLQPSLPHDILLDLGLTERPVMVTRAFDVQVQRPDLADQVHAPGTRLLDVFDSLDRALLILGAPGAGKTTLLLTLARNLLIRGAQDPEKSIPVVFPLSSWTARRRPLADWLVDELQQRYGVRRKIGQAWIDADHVLPLLDGLDEVQAEHRAACAEAINTFRQEHGLLPLVVCSRVADYEALGVRLQLHGAIVVRPLTREQVDAYLTQVGAPLAPVRQALQEDPTLWELLDTPLMLYVVTSAYAGRPATVLHTGETPKAQQRYLFAAYVERMFQRRSVPTRYLHQQAEGWLAWIAWQMAQHSQTVFYLERLQPDCLPPRQRWIPTTGVAWGVGLVFGLGGWLVFGLGGLGIGLVFGQAAYSRNFIGAETPRWSWRSAVRSYLSVLVAGLGLMRSGRQLAGLGEGLFVGLGFGVGFGESGGQLARLAAGLSSSEIKTSTAPNEGIHRSARMALGAGLGAGLGFGVGFGLSGGLGYGLGVGLGAGLVAGLGYGGRTCLQHVILRLLLVCNGTAPWRYVDFLDYAAERIFLRKVGGGYIFLHRLLQEYFAASYTDSGRGPPDHTNRSAYIVQFTDGTIRGYPD